MLFRRKRNDFFRVHTLKKRKNVAGLSTRLALPTLAPGLLPLVLLALAPGLALATTHLVVITTYLLLTTHGIIRATATPSARPTLALPLVLLALVLLALALGLPALGLLPLALTAKLGRTC